MYYFYVVSKEGSIKSASLKLHISQPAISVQLKALEDEIGFKLFHRSHRKLILTDFGRVLKLRAEELFLLADEIVAEFPRMGFYPKEHFNIGVLRTIPACHVMKFSNFLWHNTLLETTIVEHSREGLLIGLDNESLDFVLSDQSEAASDRYLSIHLGSFKLIVFSGKEFMSENKEFFPLNLNNKSYLSQFSRGQTQREIEHYFSRNNISPKLYGRVDSISLIKMIVEKSTCFGILPLCVLDQEIELGTLYQIGELPNIVFNLWGIFPKSSSQKINIQNVISAYID